MEHEILDLIDRYWKFDNDQTPVSNWHDKQDLLEAVRKALRIHDVISRLKSIKRFNLNHYRDGEYGIDTDVEYDDNGQYIDSYDLDVLIRELSNDL